MSALTVRLNTIREELRFELSRFMLLWRYQHSSPPFALWWRLVLKRFVDLSAGLAMAVVSAPIMLAIAILIKLDSAGPIFFVQERVGLFGRPFTMYKFRTMRHGAEQDTGPVWASVDGDPRVTRVGRWLRRSHLDELPQVFHVITGDMSLVGPRPERPELIEKFKDEIPNYNARHEIRTGLTGWAQIHGLRGDTDLRKRIEADLYYLENWSVFLDFTCLFGTIFNHKNAH